MSSEPGHTADNSRRRGLLFIVSAPSGTGKTTLIERLVRMVPDLHMSRSYTSRACREGECDGVDYNFISRLDFETKIGRGDFLEWADVFGNLYGTGAADTDALLAQGQDLMLVIDVQGARQVRARRLHAATIFVMPPSLDALEHRLRGRSKDSEAAIQRRLTVAAEEVASYVDYDYVVINDDFAACLDRLRGIVLAERSKIGVVKPAAEGILKTFGGRSG
jgi:guanylate kinase